MGETKGIKIRFEAESSPVHSALNKIEKDSKSLSRQLKEIDKLLELDPSNVTLLQQKQELLAKAVGNTAEKLRAMEAAQDEISAGYSKWEQNQQAIADNAAAIDKMRTNLENAKEAVEQLAASQDGSEDYSAEYEAASKKVEEYTKALADLEKQQKALSKRDSSAVSEADYQRYITDTEALRINLQQLQTQQESVNESISAGGLAAQRAAQQEQERVQAEEQANAAAEAAARAEEERRQAVEASRAADEAARTAANNYSEALDKVKNSAGKVKDDISSMAAIAAKGAAAIGAATAAGITASTKIGMSFTSSMSKVQALSGASADELERLKNAASEAGALTSKSASQAADALGYMALAGWDTSQMLEGLMPMIRASEAGEMDLARCSDLVTDSMAAMGIAVGDLEHYLDVCTNAQANSNTSMEQLLEAYTVCGGSLKNFNVSAEESAAVLGLLANRGTKGSEAGTALNSILVNLIGTTKSTSYALDTLGVSAFDDNGKFIGLSETLKRLKIALDEYGDDVETIAKLEAKLGGKTQLDTLQKLLAGVSEEYDTLEQSITDCNGALENTSKTMQDNLSGDVTSLKSALEGLGQSVFDYLEEPFRSAVQEASEQIRNLRDNVSEGELAELLQKLSGAFGTLLEKTSEFAANTAIPTIIKWLGWFSDNAGTVMSLITGMGAAWAAWKIGTVVVHVQELITGLQAYRAAAAAAETQQIALNTASAANVYVALAAAIAAVTVAIGTWLKASIEVARQELQNRNALGDTTQAIYDEAAALEKATKAAEEHCKEIDNNYDTAKELWEQVKSLCDEEGNAGENFAKVEAIVAALNDTAGTNITMVNGQIQGYKDLTETMDGYIEKARTAAQIDYLKPMYGEAVTKIGGVQSQLESVISDLHKAVDDYDKEKAKLDYMTSDIGRQFYTDAQIGEQSALVNNIGNTIAELGVQRSALQSEVDQYQGVIDDFESIYAQDVTPAAASSNPMADAMAAEGEKMAEQNRKNAELAKQGVKQTYEELTAALDKLDNDLATHKISDEDYWSKRRELLEASRYEENAEWWKIYDEVEKHYSDLADKEAAEQEKASAEAQKTADEAAKKRTEAAKTEFDELVDAYNDGVKDYETFCKEYADMQTRWAEKSVDISDYTAKKIKTVTKSAVKADFDELKKQYDDGLIDYQTFYKNYTALIEKWSSDVTTVSKDTADMLGTVQKDAAKKEFDDLKKQYDDGLIDYQTFCDKYAALQKKWSKDKIDLAKLTEKEVEQAEKTYKDGLKKNIEDAEKAIDKLQSEYKSALDKLLSEKDSYFNKLFDTSSFVSKSTQKDENGKSADIFSLSDPEEAYKKLVEYEKALEDIQARGVSQNVTDWINGLDMETAQSVMDVLGSMSDDKLKQYSDSFDKYRDKAASMADDKYSSEIDELNKNFVNNVLDELGIMPDAATTIGGELINGFIAGMLASADDVSEAVRAFSSMVLDGMKENLDIHSPSKETKEMGEYTAEGFLNGLADTDVSSAVDSMVSGFISALAEKDPEIRKALEAAFGDNMNKAVTDMNGKAFSAFEDIAGNVMNIIPALPDISKIALPAMEISQSVNADNGNELLNTIIAQNSSVIDKLTRIAESSVMIELKQSTEVSGTLTADMNTITAAFVDRVNDISFLTGQRVFNQ